MVLSYMPGLELRPEQTLSASEQTMLMLICSSNAFNRSPGISHSRFFNAHMSDVY